MRCKNSSSVSLLGHSHHARSHACTHKARVDEEKTHLELTLGARTYTHQTHLHIRTHTNTPSDHFWSFPGQGVIKSHHKTPLHSTATAGEVIGLSAPSAFSSVSTSMGFHCFLISVNPMGFYCLLFSVNPMGFYCFLGDMDTKLSFHLLQSVPRISVPRILTIFG